KEGLSSYGFYLRAYALFMAGERRKEEEYNELESSGTGLGVSEAYNESNELGLSSEGEQQQQQQPRYTLDAFGLYVYGMLLKEAKNESIPCPHPPHMILVESLLEFPLNWSAWLDLCEVEQTLQPILATHYMYHFFCAHLMAHHHSAHEDALVLLERLYEPLPDQPLFQSPHLKTQLAVVHYHLRELEQALMWFKESAADDRYSLDHKDVYSNILYVKEDRVALSHLAHEAVVIDKYRPETCCIVGNYYSLKQQRQKAVLYFQRALKLDRSYTSAWTLMGHEYVELKQTEQAMESYRRAVTVSPKDYRAWYGLGQTYEFLNMYLYALFYYRKAATLRPYDPRMWCAVGQCFSALHKIQDAIRAYERAVAQEDNEGIATQKLAALYRQEGRQEEAAMCYIRHLELRYLGIVLESVEAEALLFLAQYHKSHGEFDTAALMCSRLVEYPGPEKEQAKGLLRDLRSRGRRYPT
ncbi:TPR-like protein, partial [Fragilariopsis cylindrus CCMP1102]